MLPSSRARASQIQKSMMWRLWKGTEEDGTNDVETSVVKKLTETVDTGAGDFHRVSEANEVLNGVEIVDDVEKDATVPDPVKSVKRYVEMNIYDEEQAVSDAGGVCEDDVQHGDTEGMEHPSGAVGLQLKQSWYRKV